MILAATSSLSFVSEPATLSNTAAGRCAAAYFDAFNSGNDESVQAFQEEYRTLAYLESLSLEKRLKNHERLRGIFGRLTPLRVVLSLELQLTLLADAAKTDDVLVMRFQLENDAPHRMSFVRFTGIDHAQVTDAYVLYVADRAHSIDNETIEETVRSVARVLSETYVDPDMGKAMADTLLAHLSVGFYGQAKKTGQLADMLTGELLDVSRDEHVWVEATNPMLHDSAYPENRPVEELRRENYHFRKIEVLPGNVGYLKFDMIHDDAEAQDVAASALAAFESCGALIFDLRNNIGGEWGSGRLILSYVLPANTILSRTFDRSGGLVETDSTLADLPGRRFDADVPVYALTSERTGSAAEAFAFAVQKSGRGKVVGRTTRGAGYRCDEVRINPMFILSVSTLRAVSAFTGESFQGVGVVPDIDVPEENALDAALEDASARMHSPEKSPR